MVTYKIWRIMRKSMFQSGIRNLYFVNYQNDMKKLEKVT